jgi:hypothetical protein
MAEQTPLYVVIPIIDDPPFCGTRVYCSSFDGAVSVAKTLSEGARGVVILTAPKLGILSAVGDVPADIIDLIKSQDAP